MTSSRITTIVALIAIIVGFIWPRSPNDGSGCVDDPPLNLTLTLQEDTTTRTTTPVYPCRVFSDSYHQARDRFIAAAKALQKEPYHKSPQLGGHNTNTTIALHRLEIYRDESGETYTTDIVVIPGNQPGLVFHSSGVHGVEGYAGSAVQVALLQLLRRALLITSFSFPTIVLIHVINPVGMARFRRFNENNVDLNRNGLTAEQWDSPYVQQNSNRDSYNRFSRLFFNPKQAPTAWSAGLGYYWQAAGALSQYGLAALKEAMVRGQYHDPTGIFYGGTARVESSWQLLGEWLVTFVNQQKQQQGDDNVNQVVTWIDLHTGLGKFGVDTILMGDAPGMTPEESAKQVENYFPDSQHPGSSADGSSVAQGYEQVKGSCKDFVETVFAPEQLPLVATQEFGTLHTVLVGRAMIVENAAYQHLPPDQALKWAKQTTKAAFYPQNKAWRKSILERGIRVLVQAMDRSLHLSK